MGCHLADILGTKVREICHLSPDHDVQKRSHVFLTNLPDVVTISESDNYHLIRMVSFRNSSGGQIDLFLIFNWSQVRIQSVSNIVQYSRETHENDDRIDNSWKKKHKILARRCDEFRLKKVSSRLNKLKLMIMKRLMILGGRIRILESGRSCYYVTMNVGIKIWI